MRSKMKEIMRRISIVLSSWRESEKYAIFANPLLFVMKNVTTSEDNNFARIHFSNVSAVPNLIIKHPKLFFAEKYFRGSRVYRVNVQGLDDLD